MELPLGFNEETILVEDAEKTSSSSSSYGYKLVPWLNWNEWEWVRGSLFSNSPHEIASAIARISTWRSRGCLPVVIDVTASIIEIQQKDPFYRNDLLSDALHSEQMLAMLYCMAILRLVNCVVEKTRKKTEISIAEAAAAIGIPRTLIDIRHEGSHRDLPALTLVRDSAVKAILWLKSYYWEPQAEQIPFRIDETSKIRKEVKIKLQELASCLRAQGSPQSGALPIKGKSHKHKELPCGRNKFFSLMASKLYASKSGGLKKQTTKTLKSLVRLYSSYSSEVLSVLFELILEALDSSNLLVYLNEVGQEMHTFLEDWKLVIVKLSNKEPELLLTLLTAILDMIKTQEALKYEIGPYYAPIESRAGTVKIERLSSLFAWLVGKLKLLKPFHQTDGKAKTEASAAELNMSIPILIKVLRKCLVLSSYGNKELTDSAMDLAKLVGGNSRLMEKLSKISSLGLSDLDITEENSSHKNSSHLLIQLDHSLHEAAKKLEFVKLNLAKRRIVNRMDADMDGGGRWAVAKSWNPCPIGMLPRDLGSSGCVPVLDHHYIDKKSSNPSERTSEVKQNSGAEKPSSLVHSDNLDVESSKREASSDICLLDSSSVKKMRKTLENWESGGKDVELPTDIQGCLMINGVWKCIEEDELLTIKSGVRILV